MSDRQLTDRESARLAYDIKELRERLRGFSDDELKQIPVLCEGERLETGATYMNLHESTPHDFEALGDEDVPHRCIYAAKKDVPCEIWNRLLGMNKSARSKKRE